MVDHGIDWSQAVCGCQTLPQTLHTLFCPADKFSRAQCSSATEAAVGPVDCHSRGGAAAPCPPEETTSCDLLRHARLWRTQSGNEVLLHTSVPPVGIVSSVHWLYFIYLFSCYHELPKCVSVHHHKYLRAGVCGGLRPSYTLFVTAYPQLPGFWDFLWRDFWELNTQAGVS